MNKTSIALIAIVSGIALSLAVLGIFNTSAYADRQSQPNAFGKGASELGKSGQMGEHASKQSEPRLGIGNVGNALCNEKLKPGDLAGVLNNGPCP